MLEFAVPTNVSEWMQDHVRRYLESDGADGHMWDGGQPGRGSPIPTLLLVTKGRRTGKSRTLPLIYGESGDAYLIVGSKGGSPAHPYWYLNLVAQPEVAIQVGAQRMRATARTATGEERETLWAQMSGLFPPYIEYQQRTEREIPLVVLDPIKG